MVKQLKVCTFIQLLSDKEKYKFQNQIKHQP